jgi:hypothetical protein
MRLVAKLILDGDCARRVEEQASGAELALFTKILWSLRKQLNCHFFRCAGGDECRRLSVVLMRFQLLGLGANAYALSFMAF